MPCDLKAALKTGQVLVCGVGLVYKILTTWEAERLTRQLQKQSLEWSWARFTEPISLSSVFMDLAFGAYFIITLCLLIGHLYGDQKTVGENILLVVGCLMMIAVGGILVVSIDDVPRKLYVNTVVLGVLALVAAVLLLTDAGTKCVPKERPQKVAKQKSVKKKKKDIEIVHQEPQKKEEHVVVEEKTDEAKIEDARKKEIEEPVKENVGISSVEIRIKDPKKNWPVYGERTRATSEIDVLAEAEAVDRMLSRGVAIGRTRGNLSRLTESPLRHTSSFYISQAPQFAWKRLSERAN